jgi:uncharacterized repeat protein (TIGR01451 family)
MERQHLGSRVAVVLALGIGLTLGLLHFLSGSPDSANAASPLPTPVPRAAAGSAGDVITVCLGGGCPFDTIQDAVDAAGDGDEIRVAGGTYSGVSARAGVTQVVYISKTLTLRGGYTTTNWHSPNPISFSTTLDAERQGRVLTIVPPAGSDGAISPTIMGLRITGGDAAGLGGGPSWVPDAGGGVYVVSATATISGNQIVSNTADCGGGIYVSRSDSTVRGNEVWDNEADYGGGMGLVEGSAAVQGNTVWANTAAWGGALYSYDDYGTWEGNAIVDNTASVGGGGMCLHAGDGTLTNNAFSSNGALYGGGLYVYQSTAVMAGNAVTGNAAGVLGGGLYIRLSESTVSGGTIAGNAADSGGGLYLHEGQPVVREAEIMENSAEWGGGVFVSRAYAALSGNRITANSASLGGGGVALVKSEVDLNGNRITVNSAEQGGGLYVLDSAAQLSNTLLAENGAQGWGSGVYLTGDSAAAMQHTTLVGNGWGSVGALAGPALVDSVDGTGLEVRAGSSVALTNTILARQQVGVYAASGAEVNLYRTLLGAGAWANGEDWAGQGTVTHSGDVVGDPDFVNPEAGDYHIGLDSAAVEAGIDAGVAHDIDGQPRPMPAGGGFDLGADEFAGIDLSLSRKEGDGPLMVVGEPLTYTLSLLNRGWQTATGTQLVDAIPEHTIYASGTAYATSGSVSDGGGIHWTGTLAPQQPVTVGFRVTVTEQAIIHNVAVITDPFGVVSLLMARLAPYDFYLPLIVVDGDLAGAR